MALIHSILMGAVAGMRSMTPLAAVANAARTGTLPRDNGAPRLLANPLASAGMLALAGGELAGDKMKTAPDRIVLAGMMARVATGAIAGAALAPRHQRGIAALLVPAPRSRRPISPSMRGCARSNATGRPAPVRLRMLSPWVRPR